VTPAAYRFGPFVVDRGAYRVLHGGRPLDLTPKLLDLLLHLLDHAGNLVTKEALLDALWPDANVTDNALTQAVSELRQALGDDASAPEFIKTVARRGYRFVAPVEVVVDAPAIQNAAVDERAIAVLDFTNVSGDADSAWLSAGIAETVSADLRALGRFRVVDRWRVNDAARRTHGSLHDVAAALRVRLAVVGSFQRNGERVRITARVVDVVSGEAVADAKVDGRLDDIFELQDQVAAQFAKELGVAAAVPDDARGERLVAFYTDPLIAPHELWERLCRTELPRLWLPKREDLRVIDAIPSLGTGKVDLRGVRQLAAAAEVAS
jgi:DNA-binding winged helix-turn-helix (wHTH) protein